MSVIILPKETQIYVYAVIPPYRATLTRGHPSYKATFSDNNRFGEHKTVLMYPYGEATTVLKPEMSFSLGGLMRGRPLYTNFEKRNWCACISALQSISNLSASKYMPYFPTPSDRGANGFIGPKSQYVWYGV